MEEEHKNHQHVDNLISEQVLEESIPAVVSVEASIYDGLTLDASAAGFKRLLVLLSGVILFAVGGLFFYSSGIGMDPLSVFYGGVSTVLNIRIGSAAFLINVLILFLLIFVDRSQIGIGTLAVSLGIGPLLNILLHFFSYTAVGWRLALLSSLLGLMCYSTAIALCVHADLGCGPVDALMLYLSNRYTVTLRTFKILFDIFSVGIGYLLGGVLGLGTMFAVFLSGPVMCVVMDVLDRYSCIKRDVINLHHGNRG